MALKRHDERGPATAPFGKPTTRLATPNVFDLVVVEDVLIAPENYRPLPYKTPHPDFANNGLVLVWQGPVKGENNQINVRRVYADERDLAENWYNFAIKYSGDASTNPIFIRSYTTLRENYTRAIEGSLLTAIVTLRVTARGSGYSRQTPPTVSITGGGGTGATAAAIISKEGVIVGLQLLTEGTGYTSAPTVSITGGGGTGATAVAVIQPANAYLVKEELSKLDDVQMDSIFVRVNRIYEVLPGPWLPYSRWDDNLGPVQGLRRAVLITNPPQASTSDVGMKTVYDARDGSSVVAMEIIETWGNEPYAKRFEVEIDDPTPAKFRGDAPTVTQSQIEPGRPQMPVLGENEFRKWQEEVNKFWRRTGVTRREGSAYPRDLYDYELGGVRSHGAVFGDTLETLNRLDDRPQIVEGAFDVLEDKVDALGHGLTLRRRTKLFTGGRGLGPYIELLTGGEGYVDDPAVIFASGVAGSGAAGTASISQTPIAPGGIDPGGTFTQTFASNGDGNGIFTFIGKRYNGDVWQNPATAGNVSITAKTHPSYPQTQERLNTLVDHSAVGASVGIVPQPGGSHYIMIDLGVGRTLKANKVVFQLNSAPGAAQIQQQAKVYGFNKFGVSPTLISPSNINLPQTTAGYTNGNLTNSTGYRYFWIVGADAQLSAFPEVWPVLTLGEIELYGELTILPAVELGYNFDGDENGAFHYLGARGNGGTWRNPQTAGDIVIDAPSDTLALGTFDSIVDREPSNTYFANRDQAFVRFDLGANRSLLLDTVSLRQRADFGSSMTQVKIQGSTDGTTWGEFQLLTISPTAGAWTKVDITTFTQYYRYFRLILPAGKTFLAVGELELYGTLQLNAAGSGEAPGFSVTGILITNQGDGYGAAPAVVLTGGGGTGAAGTAVVVDGKVVRVDMTSVGRGYTTAPTVAFVVASGGSGATLEAVLTGGVVTAITVLNGGTGYTVAPTVKIVSATGTGATAHAVLTAGVVTSVVVDSGGSGYARVPTVVAYPPTDPEADAEIGFGIAEIDMTDGGEGYSSPPAVHVAGEGATPARAVAVLGFPVASVVIDDQGHDYVAPGVSFGGDGSGAAGIAIVGKGVAATAVTAGGSGYLTEPVVQVDGDGAGAQFQALIGRMLLRIDVAAQGGGYTSNPAVVITGDGSGAAAHVVRSFGVASILVGAGGAAYTVAPAVAITAPTGINGRQATAHAVLTAGAVTSIVVDDPGFGYLTAPTATLSGGDGAGATAGAVTLASAGSVNNIVIDTGGSNFSVPPTISFTGGAGTGAAASAVLNTAAAGPIVRLAILNAGSGFTAAPTLTILDGTSGGTGATSTATLSTSGTIKAVNITNGGSGYTAQPPITFHTAEVLTYVSDGDANGVFYRLGTNYGAVAWANPHTAGRLTVSCIEENNGTMAEVVDRVSSEVFTTNTNPDPWFKFDLGVNVSLVCNHASYRQRTASGGSNTTGFSLQGSNNNGSTWTTLNTQSGIATTGNTWRSFAVTPTVGYRYFRIQMVGVTNFFTIGEFELYGDLTHGVGGGGSGALATAVLAPTGSVKSVSVVDPGDGFRSGAEVTFAGGGGTGAAATVVANTCGHVTRVILTKPGGPFTVPPDVIFVGGQSGGCGLPNDGPIEQEFVVHGSGGSYNGFQNLATVPVLTLINPGDVPDGIYTIQYTSPSTGGGLTLEVTVVDDEVTNSRVSYGGGTVDYGSPFSFFVNDGYILDASNISVSFNFLGAAVFTRTGGTAPIRWAPTLTLIRSNHYTDNIAASQEVISDPLTIILGDPPTPATAVYRLGSGYPTFIDEHVDSTEGILVISEKTIVKPTDPRPIGKYFEKEQLDLWRSFQIVSRVDLSTLPPPEVYYTSQHLQLPKLLLSVYPIWDSAHAEATAGGLATGTQRGSVSASVQVIGNIIVRARDGFRGAALAIVERQFFFGPPPQELVPQETIITPATGTASTVTTRQSKSRSGLTYTADGQSIPGGDFASRARSSASAGASTQVVDLNNMMTGGYHTASGFVANNASFADALNVQVSAFGTFRVDLPASTPFAFNPGDSILAQVGVERWRLGVYVRTLVRVIVPQLPTAP